MVFITFIYWKEIVKKSLDIKSKYVKSDPYDVLGQHKALSLGHTIANVLETLLPTISHGEAVLNGLRILARIQELVGIGNPELHKSIFKACNIISNSRHEDLVLDKKSILMLLRSDKISTSNTISLVLIPDWGIHTVKHDLEADIVLEGFASFFKVV